MGVRKRRAFFVYESKKYVILEGGFVNDEEINSSHKPYWP